MEYSETILTESVSESLLIGTLRTLQGKFCTRYRFHILNRKSTGNACSVAAFSFFIASSSKGTVAAGP